MTPGTFPETLTLSAHTPVHRTRNHKRISPLPCPDCLFLFKWKSAKQALPPAIKGREVLTCTLHPLKVAASLCGRALTRFWKEVVAILAPRDIISMSALLPFVAIGPTNVTHPLSGTGWSMTFKKCPQRVRDTKF